MVNARPTLDTVDGSRRMHRMLSRDRVTDDLMARLRVRRTAHGMERRRHEVYLAFDPVLLKDKPERRGVARVTPAPRSPASSTPSVVA
jgi:hypothetical protein